MANTQDPFGLRVLESEGTQYRVRRYVKKSTNAIYPGDAVIAAATGDIDVATGADGVVLLGVALEYGAAGSTAEIGVCDDPNAVFEIQADASIVAADVFQNANITAGAGDAVLRRSGQDLDVASLGVGATKQLKILGLSAISDNAYGAFARVKVKIQNHVFGQKAVGV
jgi:hypothetical protein